MDASLEVIYDGGPTRMVVSGELDLVTSPWLARAVDDQLGTAEHVVVDLTRARLCDSTPLVALMRAIERATGAGRLLEVVSPYWPVAG
jgi:ABC-type transporter Mla MlaB component